VKRTLAEGIVEFLSFSSDSSERTELGKFSPREWARALQWLDDANLAFYFLQKLKDKSATETVPASVISRLEQNFATNQQRVDDMSQRFDVLNNRFNAAGVRYAVIKGFSLVPEYCPSAPLRHQGDFDYLIEEQSLPAARRVLVDSGYVAKQSPSSQESIFVIPSGEPSRSATQYSARAPHAVELHLDIWDSDLHSVPSIPRLSVERSITHHWSGSTFPALADEDAFLLQVLHACHHLFTQWIRMSCLFEIGYFLNRRASDEDLWNRIEQCVGDSAVLREFVVIVTELVAKLFVAPIPPLVRAWGATIRPGPRVWIDNYARRWAFCDLPVYQFSLFPRSKLVRFLHQQYTGGAPAQKHVGQVRASSSRLGRIASTIRNNPSLVLDAGWWKRQLLVRRAIFHALAGVRYLCEIPRWIWLNRARVRSASVS
jgi:putative nucleotidyltransferase-like protein